TPRYLPKPHTLASIANGSGYALIRTGQGDDARWLLIKMKDDEADARRKPTTTERESVLSGRTLEEVAEEGHPDQGE
ncbi:MAG: hypothetical protein ACOC70_02115, partial [bacterium]